MATEWLWVALDAFVKITAIISLFEGSRQLSRHGTNRKALLTITVGAFMCATWSSINYLKYSGVTEILSTLKTPNISTIPPPEKWSPSLSPEKKEEIGLEMARHDYFRSGELKNYIDRTNSSKLFAPSQNDISEREASLKQLAQIEFLANARYVDAITWILWGILASLGGFALGKNLKHKQLRGPDEGNKL